MFSLTRKGHPIGYRTDSKETAETMLQKYIEDHSRSEAGQVQQRVWNETKRTILFSDAESIAYDNLVDQMGIVEL